MEEVGYPRHLIVILKGISLFNLNTLGGKDKNLPNVSIHMSRINDQSSFFLNIFRWINDNIYQMPYALRRSNLPIDIFY